MGVYVIPDWLTIIAGLVIYRRRGKEKEVLFGLRSARAEEGKWCLPTGKGAIRRDISSALAAKAPESLDNPMAVISSMSARHREAFFTPPGFALAETRWYVELPREIAYVYLIPLKPVCELDTRNLLVKIYYAMPWVRAEPPPPAKTEWPFKEVRFFSRKELKSVPIAFGCDKDLEEIFWRNKRIG